MRLLLLVLLACCLVALAEEYDSRGFVKIPSYYRYVQIQGEEYIKGTVYLDTHADTALITPLGFRNLQFRSRGFRCVKYDALWPKGLVLETLPRQVSGVEYDPIRSSLPKIFIFVGWEGPSCRSGTTAGLMDCMRAARCRYAFPASGDADYYVDGKGYVGGQLYLFDEADTSALQDLGFRKFQRATSFKPILRSVVRKQTEGEIPLPKLARFHCEWPALLDLSLLPVSVIELASDSVLARLGMNPQSVYLCNLEVEPYPSADTGYSSEPDNNEPWDRTKRSPSTESEEPAEDPE